MGIPAIGPITALTWTLEVGDVQRFSLIKKAIIYCGLCGAEKSSGCTVQRTPLSKQRNKHLQTTLIEAATMGPRYSLTRPSVKDFQVLMDLLNGTMSSLFQLRRASTPESDEPSIA